MFASVIQHEHKQLNAKTSKKEKNTPKIFIDNESSNSSDENMSVDHMTVTTTDKSETASHKVTDETDEDKTYQSRIENLGEIIID
jgi:hypothetical protein